MAVVPGAELQIPVGSRTVLKPFGQFGVGHAIIYGGDSPISSGFSEHYISLQLGVELRHPLGANQGEIGFSIGSATPFRSLGLSNPRIGVGFIFGGGLTVLHVNFGFQF